jgi:hypothetical protein
MTFLTDQHVAGLTPYGSPFYFTVQWYSASDFSGLQINEFFTTALHAFCNESHVIPIKSAITRMIDNTPTDLTEVR